MKSMRYNAPNSLLTKYLAASLGLAVASVMIPQSVHAATDTWSGATSGVWDTATANWVDDGTGDTLFNSGNDAWFTGAPANNVTAATGLTIGGITLDNTFTGSVAMTGANTVSGATTISGGTLNLNSATGLGASAVTVNNGGTLAINPGTGNATVANNISGSGLITAQDPGAAAGNTLTLSGSYGGFAGTLNILAGASNNGKVNFSTTTQANAMSSGTIQIQSGATLYLNKALNYGASVQLSGTGNAENLGALRLEASANQTGSVTLLANSYIGVNATAATISGNIGESGGSFGFTKLGNSTLTLSGNNSFTGQLILSNGLVSVGSDSAGAYNLGGATGNNGITFDGGGLQITGTTITNLGSHTPTFNAGKTGTFDIANVANNFTISQSLSQITGALVKTGAGTLTLSGSNSYTGGTRANAGTTVLAGSQTAGGFLSVNNTGAGNAVVKIASGAGTLAYTDMPVAESNNTRGAVYQQGGDFSTSGAAGIGLRLAAGATSYGYYSLSSGTLSINASKDTAIGYGSGSTGVMDVTGGSLNASSWIVLGRNGGTASGLLNVTGGSVTSNSNNIGLNWSNGAGAISILNVGGGAGAASVTGFSNAANYLDVSQVSAASTTGVVNLLSNGTLTVSQVRVTGANATALFNFNGGTLKANPLNAGVNFMNSGNMDAVTVYSGGGTIDNNGTNISIGNVLSSATGNGITSIPVTDGGSGYIGAPLVKITGGTGNTATGYAVMADDGTGNGTYKVSSIVISSPGTYSVDPTTVTLAGGGASTAATIGTITTAANTSGGMTFAGSGKTSLTGANTYTGATTILSGTLADERGAGLSALGSSSGLVIGGASGSSNATFSLTNNGKTISAPITIAAGSSGTKSIISSGGGQTFTLSGGITLNDHLTFGSDAGNPGTDAITVSGTIGGTGNVVIATGAGSTGVNLFSNTINHVGTFTNSSAGTATVTVSGGIGGNVTGVTQNSATAQLALTGINTYTGDTTVSAGTLSLADNAGLKFVIGANGVNNKIIGTGNVSLDGDFTFDLTSASTNRGDSWMIVDVANLNETFGATFSVLNAGAVEAANVWTFTNGVTEYQFTEATGVLLVVPEPTSAAMLLGGIGMLGLLRRRKK